MQTKLDRISEVAKERKNGTIHNLVYLLNKENLAECFTLLKKNKASGIDGTTISDYESNLDKNLVDLVKRMKRQAYKPKPVRRVYIPKSNGKQRPLGIPPVEDKLVQIGITRILEAIYENDFLEFSYGFRPGRSAHDAVEAAREYIEAGYQWTVDIDLEKFFDYPS